MAEIAAPLILTGGAITASNTLEAGKMADRNAASQAAIDRYNASLADRAASRNIASSQLKAKETRRENRSLISKQIAIAAASGASTSEKNIADLISRTAKEGEYAAMVDLYEGNLKADALRNEALSYRLKADRTIAEGKAARKASRTAAASSLLSAGGSAGSFYSKYNNPAPTDFQNKYPTQQDVDYGELYDL